MSPLSTQHLSLGQLAALSAQGRLFAVLDPCDEPQLIAKIEELGYEKALCLYRKRLRAEDRDALPHVAIVDEATLEWISETLWGKPWGVFLIADRPLRPLRKQLRSLLQTRGPDGEAMYFRYYDPRILEIFLPTCDEDQEREFFKEVAAFGVPDSESRRASVHMPRTRH